MAVDWIDLVKKGTAKGPPVPDDGITMLLRAMKRARTAQISIGSKIIARLGWKVGGMLQARVSRDGRRLQLEEGPHGTWELRGVKKRDHLRSTIAVPDLVQDPGATTVVTFTLDDKAGILTVNLPLKKAARAA